MITKSDITITDDAQAVNFRKICMGNIAPGTLYRSSHPVKENKQEKAVSLLASSAKIAAVVNLCDTNSGIQGKALFAPWYNRLLKQNQVIALGMDQSMTGKRFNDKLKKALQFIIGTEGPWLVHCYAGIDRTGFVCMVLEALMGASLGDITGDYLRSFDSGFKSAVHGQTGKGDSLVVMQLLSVMGGSQVPNDQNLQRIAESYLRNGIGLTSEELGLLKEKLAGR